MDWCWPLRWWDPSQQTDGRPFVTFSHHYLGFLWKLYLVLCRWEALIMVADNRQFPDLRSIVAGTKDDRIWIFAEWVSGPAATCC
jgi:hypothetical protein